MTCDHEWTHKADGRGCPYWLCRKCGTRAEDYVRSRAHLCY